MQIKIKHWYFNECIFVWVVIILSIFNNQSGNTEYIINGKNGLFSIRFVQIFIFFIQFNPFWVVFVFWTAIKKELLFLISGAIFEQGTDEVQSAFKFAMLNHNLNVTSRRFELQAYVDVINTADAFKLSRLSK